MWSIQLSRGYLQSRLRAAGRRASGTGLDLYQMACFKSQAVLGLIGLEDGPQRDGRHKAGLGWAGLS